MVERDTDLHLRKKMKNSYQNVLEFGIQATTCDSTPDCRDVSVNTSAGGICPVGCLKWTSLEELVVHKRSCSCTTIGRKRVTSMDEFSHEIIFSDCNSPASPSSSPLEYTPRKRLGSPMASFPVFERADCSPAPSTPSTPIHRRTFVPSSPTHCVGCTGDSLIEELPFDLLLRVVCCLRHDDLKPVSLVSKRLRKAVLLARQLHFSFTTPHRDKKGRTSRLFPGDESLGAQGDLDESFVRPPTPNAPRPAPKPAEARLSHFDTRPFAPPLFQEQQVPPVPNNCRKTKKIHGMASLRVLFNEDELCQAVAQNTL